MSQTKRVHLTKLAPDKTPLFVHRLSGTEKGAPDQLAQLSAFERMQHIVENVNRFRSVEQRLSALLCAFIQDTPAARRGTIYLSTARDHTFVIGATFPNRPEIIGTEIDAQGGYVDAVAQVGSPALLSDVQQDTQQGDPKQSEAHPATLSALALPFTVGGKTVGVLSLENGDRAQAFTEDDLDFAVFLSEHTALVVDNARLIATQPKSGDWPYSALSIIQSLARSLSLGVLLVTHNPRHVWGNPAFCKLSGFAQRELGNNLFRIHRSLAQRSDQREGSKGAQSQDLILTRQDKSLCPVAAVFVGLDTLGIRFAEGYVGIFEDQSTKNSLERELLHLQRMSTVGTLMSGAAHELNSPLTAIVGFAELLLTREDIPVDSCQDLRTITRQAERSIRVMRELLDYVQLESKDPMPIDIHFITRQLVRFRKYALQASNVAIKMDLVGPPPYVLGNAQQLQQVLLNLINNAEQACSSIDSSCELWIRTETFEGHKVRITVSDNGPGISTELRSHVFEPFFTTRPIESTGLGLAVCQQIIAQHGGRIWFESEPGKETTFFIDLPLDDTTAKPKRDNPPQWDPQDCVLPARILVVDDEKSISHLLAKVLTRNGHHVDVALDGREALNKLQKNVYDIIFLDLKIPGVSGQAVYGWIKRNDAKLLQRTVVLTGDTLNADTISFLEQERVAHLLKPFQLVELRNMLDRVWPG
jgi:signal transduction histidine kinase/CheY-like chemotaxis protein/putative methionine-R-sulfoxide reductase with GAF domain